MKKIILSLLIAVGLIGSASAAVLTGDLTNGLTAYYSFNGNANDSSGNGLNGVIASDPGGATNLVSLTNNQFGDPNSAYNFTGVIHQGGWDYNYSHYASSWISVPNSGQVLSQLTNWTISCNVQINGASDDVNGRIITREGVDYSGQNGFYLDYNLENGFSTGSGYGGGGAGTPWDGTKISIGNWYYVTATYNGSIVNLYVNGVNTISQSIALNNSGNQDLSIGRHVAGPISNPPGFYSNLNGVLDNVGIWNTALSSDQVSQLYALQSVPEPSTYALFGIGAIGMLMARRRKE
jgi:trimeric autotransporter adhesin